MPASRLTRDSNRSPIGPSTATVTPSSRASPWVSQSWLSPATNTARIAMSIPQNSPSHVLLGEMLGASGRRPNSRPPM